MYEDRIIYDQEQTKEQFTAGILLQSLGQGEEMSVLHWDLEDGSVVDWHEHSNEQFGYVIAGGFKVCLGDEEYELKAGDAYYVPADVQHKFVARGATEAIDVFSPPRENLPEA